MFAVPPGPPTRRRGWAGGHHATEGEARAIASGAGVNTEWSQKSPGACGAAPPPPAPPSARVMLLQLQHKQQARGSCGQESAGRDALSKAERQRDHRSAGKASEVALAPSNSLLLLVVADAALSCCRGCPEVPGSTCCHCSPLKRGHEGPKTAEWSTWPGLQEEQGWRQQQQGQKAPPVPSGEPGHSHEPSSPRGWGGCRGLRWARSHAQSLAVRIAQVSPTHTQTRGFAPSPVNCCGVFTPPKSKSHSRQLHESPQGLGNGRVRELLWH